MQFRVDEFSQIGSYRRMSYRSLLVALATLSCVASAQATVLTFDISGTKGAGFGDGSEIPGDYGDHVTSGTAIGSTGLAYQYDNFGEGFTPAIAAQYNTTAAFFGTGYGALVNIAYAENGMFSLTLTAAAGFTLDLYSFDLAGLDSNYQIDSVSVTTDGVGSFTQSDVIVHGSSSGTGLTSFDFATPISGTSMTIEFDARNLGVGNWENVGIDNIRFDQVPEPSVTALLAAAGGLGLYFRRRRSA
jgi:hypothetical protein